MGWARKARSGGVGDERNVRMAGLELLRARAKVVAVPSEVQVAQFGLSFSDDVAFAEQDLGIPPAQCFAGASVAPIARLPPSASRTARRLAASPPLRLGVLVRVRDQRMKTITTMTMTRQRRR